MAQSPPTTETGRAAAGDKTLNSGVRGNGVEPDLTSSSLLSLVSPIKSPALNNTNSLNIDVDELFTLLHTDEEARHAWAQAIAIANQASGFEVPFLLGELRKRRGLISSVESYLMANRGIEDFAEFSQRVAGLVIATLAFALGNDTEKTALRRLFMLIAEYIEGREAAPLKQAAYAKTLLDIETAQQIEAWTLANKDHLLASRSNSELLNVLWPLFKQHCEGKFFTSVLPVNCALDLAVMWLEGRPYELLFKLTRETQATKPWGSGRRDVQNDDVIEYCENTLGFECSLIVAAVIQFASGEPELNRDALPNLLFLQKSLKYGTPDALSISCYEAGFADRMLAQELARAAVDGGYAGNSFQGALESHRSVLAHTISQYPSYFECVFGNAH